MSKSLFYRYGSVILLTFCFFRFLWWVFPGLCPIWDLQVEDQIMRYTYDRQGKRPVSPDIVHIDLDDQSLESLTYDKNDPRLYTELVSILRASGVQAILVDMVFPYCRNETDCSTFANEVDKAGNVYFPVILSHNGTRSKNKKSGAMAAAWSIRGSEVFNLMRGEVTMSNLEAIDLAAAGLGHINSQPDRDGVYRRIPLIIQSSNGLIPSIALRTISGYLSVGPEQIELPDKKHIILKDAQFPDGHRANIRIPVDSRGWNRINFSGAWNDSFNHYSFATILDTGRTAEGLLTLTDELEGSLAVVSDVSTGSRDFGPVPLSHYYPLSGLHSNFINSVLENDFFHEANYVSSFALDIALILLLTMAAVLLRSARFSIAAAMMFAAMLTLCFYLFMEHRFLLPVVRPSLSLMFAVPLVMRMRFIKIQQEKQYIRNRLTHYFAPSVMNKILEEPELLDTVEKKELTVLFSDIAGFTSWSSARDAEEIHQTLNEYFEEMAGIIFAHQGTIDKYMGDGLMVFFGDPIPCENHTLLAVQAAVAMQKKTHELREKWEQEGGMPITIRIGIHTGEVVVGNMGSKNRMEYTVIGSNVNLAQRLESNCQPGSILLSEEVYRNLDGTINAVLAGTIQAKGFKEAIPVYTVPHTG